MSASTNARKVIKEIRETFDNDVNFGISKAMELTIKEAVDAAETEFERYVRTQGAKQDPDDQVSPSLAKKGHNKGAIRGEWATKKELQTGKGFRGRAVESKVFIANKTEKNSRTLDLIDELHPLVFGGKVGNVPSRADTVITPTTALMRGLTGRGRLKHLGKYGNIARLKQGILSDLKKNPKLYLNVPINNTDPKTKHLSPGLYFKGREKSKGGLLKAGFRNENGRLSRSKNKGIQPTDLVQSKAIGARGRAKVKRGYIVNYLVMLLAYHDRRQYRGNFNFPDVVLKVYQDRYTFHLSNEIEKALRTGKKYQRFNRR